MKTQSLPIWRGQRDSKCSRCDLARPEINTVCVPSRVWSETDRLPRRAKCVYVIGEAPGSNEDRDGRPFVGESGKILDGWLNACGLREYADVVLANSVRCMLPGKAKPTAKQITACRHYTEIELSQLKGMYNEGSNLVVLAVGGFAAKAVGYGTLKEAFRNQGKCRDFGDAGQLPVFVTYHPASTLPFRSPQNVVAVVDHLDLLCRFLRGGVVWEDDESDAKWKTVRYNPRFPAKTPERVALDIETYGILRGQRQTVFHPTRARYSDSVARSKLVVTASVATPEGALGTFRWADPAHRERLREWVRRCRGLGIPLVLFNASFDLLFLREADAELKDLLDWNVLVEDAEVYNYLYSDVRPERSLKALSTLYGLSHYETKEADGSYKQYASDKDPELARYNQQDAFETLKVRERIIEQIEGTYGTGAKLADHTRKWYSDLIHLCVQMSEAGVAVDEAGLAAEQAKLAAKTKAALHEAEVAHGLVLQGKGSPASIRDLMTQAVTEASLWDHRDLELTPTAGELSTNAANIELCLDELPEKSVNYKALKLLQDYRYDAKILNTYLRPLIGDPELGFPVLKGSKGLALDYRRAVVGKKAYPTWRPVPSGGSGWGDSEGGTKQGRITCVNPALQTYPKLMKNYIISSHRDGYLLWCDLNQIELRGVAFLSQDAKMLGEYARGIDRHWLRARDVWDPVCPTHGNTYTEECPTCEERRQFGKTYNFALIYLAGWRRLVKTARQDIGLKLEKARAIQLVQQGPKLNPQMYAWQMALVDQVTKDGYWQDPVLGQGRWFTKSLATNREELINTIVNVPVQNIAANLMLSPQVELAKWLTAKPSRRVSRVVHNVYDAVVVDGPWAEARGAAVELERLVHDNWYVRAVEDHYQRPFPMKAKFKLLHFCNGKVVETIEW